MQFHGLFIHPILYTIMHLITGAFPYPDICDKQNTPCMRYCCRESNRLHKSNSSQ